MKSFSISILLFFTITVFGQIRLNSTSIELRKSSDFHQLLTTAHPKTHEITSFVADKEKIIGLQYNSAIFLSDSLTIEKPENFRFLMGCSYVENDQPVSYWANKDLSEFYGITFDFENKTTTTTQYNLYLKEDKLFAEFSENGRLFFISQDKVSGKIFLTIISGNTVQRKELDFTQFRLTAENKPILFVELVREYGLTKIEQKGFNSLFTTSNKVKYYVRENRLLFTLDHNIGSTTIIEVDLTTFVMKQVLFKNESTIDYISSNSLLFKEYFIQILKNKDDLEIKIRSISDGTLMKTLAIKAGQEESFFKGDFYSQTGTNYPKKFKNAKKFLRKINFDALGISLYDYDGKLISTIGGVRKVLSNGDVFLGVGLGLASIATGYDAMFLNGDDDYIIQNNAFDVVFDQNFDVASNITEPLFIDKISQVMSENRSARLDHYFPYKEYYILSYYDSKSDEIVLVKCTDGFD